MKVPEGDPDTIVVIDGDRAYERSSAVMRIVPHMTFPFWLARVFVIVPRPVRDFFYKWIARNRYRWFGKNETCWLGGTKYADRVIG